MPDSVVVVIPGRPLALGNARLHWAARMRLVRDRSGRAQVIAQSVRKGAPVPSGKCKVEAVIYLSGVPFDPDGAFSACKPELDGIVRGGLLRGDRPQDIELSVTQRKAESRKAQRVVWTISEMTE